MKLSSGIIWRPDVNLKAFRPGARGPVGAYLFVKLIDTGLGNLVDQYKKLKRAAVNEPIGRPVLKVEHK